MRTEEIGLVQFIFSRNVPGIDTPNCQCGGFRQTVKHVLRFCPQFENIRPNLFSTAGTNDTRSILKTVKDLQAATKWIMQTNLLKQYLIAKEQLYGNAEGVTGGH
jgi:hypothetical protein